MHNLKLKRKPCLILSDFYYSFASLCHDLQIYVKNKERLNIEDFTKKESVREHLKQRFTKTNLLC